MTEYELVEFHETVSDLVSYMAQYGPQKVAETLHSNFRDQAMQLAYCLLDEDKKKQVAALFKPPQ